MSVAVGYRPPPPYVSAAALLREAAAGFRIDRMPPSDAVEKYRFLAPAGRKIRWDHGTAPYLVEPLDQTVSRRYRGVLFCGPARSLKTDGLILNTILHRAICWPRSMLMLHLTAPAARSFSLRKVDDLIRECPDVASRMRKTKGADTIYEKLFVGGGSLTIGYPVPTYLTGQDFQDVFITERDKLPEDIEGLGDPVALGMKRTETFRSLGKTIIECNPSRPVLDDGWRPDPDHPHAPPPTTGILAEFAASTRGRFYWRCPQCDDPFLPVFARLQYPDTGTPAERGRECIMVCPHCGHPIDPSRRHGLNIGGLWLHETATGGLVTIDSPEVRDSLWAGYWLPGPAACFQPWHEMVARYEAARELFAETGRDDALRATVSEDQAEPYISRATSSAIELSPEALRGRAVAHPVGVAPAGTAFLTAAVDVQEARFVVQVDAWANGLERWTIDRFDLARPPEGAPGGDRAIQPALYAEDWRALDPLFARTWPVAGGEWRLAIAAVICDSGGAPGVTPRAIGWWRGQRAGGNRGRVHLVKGVGGAADRVKVKDMYPQGVAASKRLRRRNDPLYRLTEAGTNALKGEIAAALVRPQPGPGAYHLCAGLPDQVFTEMAAEKPAPGGWVLKPGQRRNEALDLAVYGRALVIGPLGGEAIRWDAPPEWAQPDMSRNSFARPVVGGERQDLRPDEAGGAGEPPPAMQPERRADPPAAPGRRVRRIRSHGIGE